MKKFSLIAAMALCVTIGGVYATWNYSQGDVATKQNFLLPSMETAVTGTSKGTIEIDLNNVAVKVDDSNNDHKAELVWSGDYIIVTFTPAQGADSAVATNGIQMTYTISVTENWTYGDPEVHVLTVNQATVQGANVSYTNGTATLGAACLEFQIPVSDLAALISIGDISLPTHQDYLNFQTKLNQGNIKITVSEYTPASNP